MSDLQRDIDLIDSFLDSQDSFGGYLYAPQRYVWQRLKPRLTPDRERVAWRLFKVHMLCGETKAGRSAFEEHKLMWLRQADAAIAAMGEP